MDWRQVKEVYPGILDSLWLFPKRGQGGDGSFHGNFVPQVPERMMVRYCQPGDIVWDPMVGSGTTIDVAKDHGLEVVGSDLTPVREDIIGADACHAMLARVDGDLTVVDGRKGTSTIIEPVQAQLIVLHPPYHDIVQFSTKPEDLSNCFSIPEFMELMEQVAVNLDRSLKIKGWIGLICGDIYSDGEVVPLAFLTSQIWRGTILPHYKMKNLVVKDIRGNERGSGGKNANLWYYRHNKNGTSRFCHEYVMMFRKEK